jgi:hypothetical protein
MITESVLVQSCDLEPVPAWITSADFGPNRNTLVFSPGNVVMGSCQPLSRAESLEFGLRKRAFHHITATKGDEHDMCSSATLFNHTMAL